MGDMGDEIAKSIGLGCLRIVCIIITVIGAIGIIKCLLF